jgi:predicted N-acetyltransferase YhbS
VARRAGAVKAPDGAAMKGAGVVGEVRYRHWQPGDDAGVLRILGPQGWCTPERYAAKFDDPGLRPEDVLVAERDGQIVGHLMLPHRRLRFGGATLPCGGVGMVVVDPAARGQGIGSALLRRALAHHRAAGNALVGLFTMSTLVPAFAMYQRHGFVPVAHRAILHLPLAALPAAAGLTARPAAASDRPALARLLDGWAAEHAGVSVEAADAPLAGQRLVMGPDGAVVGRLEVVDRPAGRGVRGGLLAAPAVPVTAVLAAGLAGETAATLPVVTNAENRVYAELVAFAHRAGLDLREERDGATLMLACLGLAPVLAGLSVELAGRLRERAIRPLRATLAVADTGERVGLDWDGRVLTLAEPDAAAPVLALPAAALVRALAGQPPPLAPPLDDVAAALFPARRTEMSLVDCW